MSEWSADFGPLDGVWLDTAHHGPLPRIAVAAAIEALTWKVAPSRLAKNAVEEVPWRLRTALARLINADAEDIILGNSASYGLHVLANGIAWREGDEVLLVDGDFPATVFPWLPLRGRNVNVRLVKPRGAYFGAADVIANLTPATRVVCTNWVNSFTGIAVDIDAIGETCHNHGLRFVINASQALGVRPLDVAAAPVDAVVACGHKWQCGPYGTGLCWIEPEFRDALSPTQAYWSAMQAGQRAESMRDYTLHDDLGAAAFDVFATANYLNVMPWTASLEYLLEQGIEAIARHDQALVTQLLEGLDASRYEVLSPREGPARSTLVIVSHREAGRNEEIHASLARDGVHVAVREGNLRLSPHLFNTGDDVHRALALLNAA